jgi:hypothetical protein
MAKHRRLMEAAIAVWYGYIILVNHTTIENVGQEESTYDTMYNGMFTKHDDFSGSRDQDILFVLLHREFSKLTAEGFICGSGDGSGLGCCRLSSLFFIRIALRGSTSAESLGTSDGPAFRGNGVSHEGVVDNGGCACAFWCC